MIRYVAWLSSRHAPIPLTAADARKNSIAPRQSARYQRPCIPTPSQAPIGTMPANSPGSLHKRRPDSYRSDIQLGHSACFNVSAVDEKTPLPSSHSLLTPPPTIMVLPNKAQCRPTPYYIAYSTSSYTTAIAIFSAGQVGSIRL